MPSSLSFPECTVPVPPSDPVSSLEFYPKAEGRRAYHLLAASWDKMVRLYDLTHCDQGTDAITLVQSFEHPAAVLDVAWINESLAASACLDRRVRLLNLENGQSVILGKHGQGVSRIRYDAHTGLLFSGGWDATLQVWDPYATPAEAYRHTISLPGKVFAMDLAPPTPHSSPRLVIAMPDRAVYLFDTQQLRAAVDGHGSWEPEQKRESSLKFMLRDVRCMPNGVGYVTSSVEGRVAVEFMDPSQETQAKKYAFKCHRKEVDGIDVVYPIHAVAFHPIYGTFATCGGDAHCALWDPIAKKRIRQYSLPSPVSTAAFSADGAVMVIASGAENLEDVDGPHGGEVGGIGPGGPGHVQLHVKPATDDAKPKVKPT
ncbi:mitotic spindle checkpoint protein Bub3 [Malassezia pachydermatis]|uniref:Mitotic checkpoint protein bub3 n=1 Tax=Malassezia pachydermatis TaxID=77020 RepID=A0A0M8MRZ9_9BASI|nr:mitotic checkpoint protein bub3 [Malassezia pachydermatis]KOS12451.1 mitotic checkpoint protein bub3 [Malassezia pachydermatis]